MMSDRTVTTNRGAEAIIVNIAVERNAQTILTQKILANTMSRVNIVMQVIRALKCSHIRLRPDICFENML